jgi:kumamolisin
MLCLAAFGFTTVSKAQTLRGSNALQPVGKLPAGQILTLDIVLPLRDPAGLDNFIALLNDPSSPSYRQFLTPSQFATMFGPSQADYDTTLAFLKANGFTVYGGTFLGREIQVKAPVSVVEAAFHVSMNVYQHPKENRTFYSPDREPTTSLPFPLWHITGLENYSIPRPKLSKRSEVAKALGVTPESLTPNATTGSGPKASFLGSDMRAAYYSAGGGTLTGAGQNLGLFEYLGTDLVDLTTYYTNAGQTLTVPVTLLSADGSTVNCTYNAAGGDCDDTEQTLDMTQALGMAPGAASLTMYIGNNDTPILSAMVTHYPLPTAIGCSWGWTPADPTSDDPYYKQMIAQGQNFMVASGDSGTWTANGDAEAWPADDANIVAVGGTDLQTASAAGPWKSETAWAYNANCVNDGCSGGGTSPDGIAIPTWQQLSGVITSTNKGSTTLRNGPDIAANADYTFYTCSDQEACLANEYGGTSFAAPMWAGYIALVNQGIAANGGSTIGFINPLIYPENLNATTYAANFHDITSGTVGNFSAVAGYDLVTGWGSPTTALATTLIGTPIGSPSFFLTSPQTSYTGIASYTTIPDSVDITSRYGFTGSVALSCAATGGMTCTLGSSSTTLASNANNSVTVSIGTGGVTATGTYTATITGVGSSGTQTLVITVKVTSITPSTFSLTPATTSYTLQNLNNLTDGLTLQATGGFTGTVGLTCSSTGGITCSATPSSVPLATLGAFGTSSLTIVVSGITSSGTYPVTITGTSGSTVVTATVNVTEPGPSFSITPATSAYNVSTSSTPLMDVVTVKSLYTYSGAVALTCVPPANSGFTCSLSSPSVTLTNGGTATSTVTIGTLGVTTPGSYTFDINGENAANTLIVTAPITVNVTVTAATFSLTNAGPITIASPGGTGSTGITTTASATFSGSGSLACAVTASPSGASVSDTPTCSVSPAAFSLTYSGTAASTLYINTTAPHVKRASVETRTTAWLAGGIFLALLLVPFRRRRLPMLALLLTSVLLLGNAIGCGGSAPSSSGGTGYADPGTTAGTYTVTVTGTSGTTTATTAVTVTVQ